VQRRYSRRQKHRWLLLAGDDGGGAGGVGVTMQGRGQRRRRQRVTRKMSWYRCVVLPPGTRKQEAEIDWQVELVSRHCLPGGLENKGNVCRQEQRESCCHGEQTEVGEAEEAEIDRQSLVLLRRCLPGGLETKRNIRRREQREIFDQKRNLKTAVKTRTLHLSEPYDSRSTTHTPAMQPAQEG
jgi:hypothetical protein